MGRRLRTCLDLIHPDTTQKVIRKQGNVENSSTPRHFKVGDKLHAKDFSGKGKWIPASVIKVTGTISYKLKTQSGHFIRRHVDHFFVIFQTIMSLILELIIMTGQYQVRILALLQKVL